MNITENSDLNKMGKSSKFSAREMARTFREHVVLVKDLVSFPALISRDSQWPITPAPRKPMSLVPVGTCTHVY